MKLSAFICMAIGVICLGAAAYFYVQEARFLQRAEHLTGTVTDLSISTSYQDQQTWTDYCPVVDFRTREGKNVEYTDDVCSNPPDYAVGQKVAIFYDPGDPKATQMQEKNGANFAASLFLIIIGVIFIAIGLGIYWADLLKKRKPAATPSYVSPTETEASLADRNEIQKRRELRRRSRNESDAERKQSDR